MKLYTKTICPKCIFVKSEIDRIGVDVEIINIDHNEEAREVLVNAGIMAAPTLEINGTFITDTGAIIEELEAVK